jgi:Tfp pilus assembly protein PilF
MWSQEQWFDRAHSVYLDWFVASGFLGLIAYLALYITLLYVIWRSDLTIGKKSVLIGLLAAYAVHNIFVFDNLASYVFFFALLGFGNSLHEGKHKHLFGDEPTRKDVVEYVVAPVVLVAFALALYFVNIRPIVANTRLIVALQGCANPQTTDANLFVKALSVNSYMANQEIREQVYSCANNVLRGNYPNVTQTAFLELANAAVEDQITATPKDARAYMLGGAYMNSIGQFTKAQSLLEKGELLSPGKQSLILELANSYINQGKNSEAEQIIKSAYLSAPENTGVKNAYVTVLVLEGKEAQARAEFKDQPELFTTDIMVRAFAQRKEYSKSIAILKDIIKKDTTNIQNRAYLAQLQYQAGMIDDATETG